MNKLLSISAAAKVLGVSESTLRSWEREGRLLPDEQTVGGERHYKLSSTRPQIKIDGRAVKNL
jgi:DNA-binding transcriptional MerR regulator